MRRITRSGLLLVVLQAASTSPVARAAEQAEEAASRRPLAVRVDPRFELEGFLLRLSSAVPAQDALSPEHKRYLTEMDRALAVRREHPAVAYYARLAANTPILETHIRVLADLTDPPGLKERIPVYPRVIGSFRGRRNLETWLSLARRFSEDSGFADLFARHSSDLQKHARRLELLLRDRRLQEMVETYAGMPLRGHLTVFLYASFPPTRFTAQGETNVDGNYEIGVMIPYPVGSLESQIDEFLVPSILHELAHGVIGPLENGFSEDMAQRDPRYDVGEYVAHAVSLRVLRTADELHVAASLSRAFLDPKIMARLDELLTRYESSRAAYPTLAEYYPRLMEAFPKKTASAALSQTQAGPVMEPGPGIGSEDWRERAIERFRAKDPEGALVDLDRALALDPGNIDVLNDRGVVLQNLKRWNDALLTYRELIALCRGRLEEPSFKDALADALSARASVLEALGRAEEAEQDRSEAGRIATPLWSGRGQIRLRTSRDAAR